MAYKKEIKGTSKNVVKEVTKSAAKSAAKTATKAATKSKGKSATERKCGNGLTEVVFILDRSGSMGGLEKDTIGGFNSTLKKQKEEGDGVIWSTVLFDNRHEVIHDRVPIKDVENLTEDEYYVRGCTALLDAIGRAVKHIGNVHKYARPEDVPEKTLFVITTDGLENASRDYTYREVKDMISRQQEKYGWEFMFLGANMDAVKEADRLGIRAERASSYHNDSIGIMTNYETVSLAMSELRDGGVISEDIMKDIEKDFEKRKKK